MIMRDVRWKGGGGTSLLLGPRTGGLGDQGGERMRARERARERTSLFVFVRERARDRQTKREGGRDRS